LGLKNAARAKRRRFQPAAAIFRFASRATMPASLSLLSPAPRNRHLPGRFHGDGHVSRVRAAMKVPSESRAAEREISPEPRGRQSALAPASIALTAHREASTSPLDSRDSARRV